MDTGLRGKRALVTGGASGIGRAIALALAAEGADVAIADLDRRPAVLAEIAALGVRAHGIRSDVSAEAEVVRMVGEAAEALGGLDLYVNNAAGAWHEPLTQVTRAAFEKTMATNVAASVFAMPRSGAPADRPPAIRAPSSPSARRRRSAHSRARPPIAPPRPRSRRISRSPRSSSRRSASASTCVTPGATDTPFVAATDPTTARRRALPRFRSAARRRRRRSPMPWFSFSPTGSPATSPAPS